MFKIKQIQYFCSCWSKNKNLNLLVFEIFIFGVGEILAYGAKRRIAEKSSELFYFGIIDA